MFEKIIKEIESIRSEIENDNGKWEMGFYSGLENAIDVVKEIELEPFNPEDFGFKLASDNFYRIYCNSVFYSTKDFYELGSCENKWFLSFYDSGKERILFQDMKINSKFEAEIVLKSLGIIK